MLMKLTTSVNFSPTFNEVLLLYQYYFLQLLCVYQVWASTNQNETCIKAACKIVVEIDYRKEEGRKQDVARDRVRGRRCDAVRRRGGKSNLFYVNWFKKLVCFTDEENIKYLYKTD